MNMKKAAVLFLVAALSVSVFAGCGGKKNKMEIPPMPEEITGEGPSYTWDTSPVEITVYVAMEGYGYKWDTKIAGMGHLTEQTGVSLKLLSGNNERLNAMIATGDIPDVVVLDSVTNPIRQQLEENGQVWDFDTLIEKYAPDMEIADSIKTWYAYEDGKLYGYPSFYGAPEDMEKYPDTIKYEYHNKLIVREDLCQKLGIDTKDFSTQDGFINALKKVKEASYTVNGNVIAPLYFMNQPHPLRIAQLFGMALEDENGDWVEVRKEDKYKEAILFINRMYREGLIPEDAWTASSELIDRKLNNGAVFALFDRQSSGNLKALQKVDPNAKMVPVDPPASKDGGDPAITAVSTSGWTWLAISKTTKVPDRIIRLLSYLLTDEGQLLNYYGVEGVTYTLDENGRVQYTPEAQELFMSDLNSANRKYGLGYFPWVFNWSTYQRFNPLPSTEEELMDKEINDYYREYVYDARCAELVEPEAGSDLLALQTKIDSYWNQEEVKMMRASSEEEAIKLYEKAVAEMDKMGLEKIYEYKNKKFHENKDKFGIDYIYEGNRK